MKLLNYYNGEEVRLGIKTDRGIVDVGQAAIDCSLDVPTNMTAVIELGAEGLEKLARVEKEATEFIAEEGLAFAPCVTGPEKVICIGLNYIDHAKEAKMEPPRFPVVFSKFNNALAAHRQNITLPDSAKQFDYEAELVIVIGKEASRVTEEEALSYVFGYTAGNDFSARDFQFRTGQWLLGKSCDGFAPIGPYLVADEIPDPNDLDIQCEVNGTIRQAGNTENMIFDCAALISYLSRHMTLKAGDLIFTGTPGGVILGEPEDKRVWLKSGDSISITVEKIGTLTNQLV